MCFLETCLFLLKLLVFTDCVLVTLFVATLIINMLVTDVEALLPSVYSHRDGDVVQHVSQ